MKLVIGGGGIKTLSFIGTISELDSQGILDTFDEIIGISGGSVVALTIVLGIPKDVVVRLISDNFPFIFSELRMSNLITRFGLSNGDSLRSLLHSIMKHKSLRPTITLRELYALYPIHLSIGVSNIDTSKGDMFSSDDNIQVVDAVMASCAIPFYYIPVTIGDHTYVDGGLMWNNLPVWLMTNEHDMGITIDTVISHDKCSTIASYVSRIGSMVATRLFPTKHSNNDHRVIYVKSDCSFIVHDSMSSESLDCLVECGRTACRSFLEKQHKI